MFLTSETNFPLPPFNGFPIINSQTNEIIYLYFPESEINYLSIILKPEGRKNIRDNECLNKLNQCVFVLLKKILKNNSLEKRIEKSYSEEIKNTKTFCSIIIEMNEKFKKKKIIQEKLSFFRNFNRDLFRLKMQNNPFETIKLKSSDGKEILPKVGKSFIDKERIHNEFIKDNEEYQEFITSYMNKLKKHKPHFNKVNYKKILKKIFVQIKDFRKSILEHCLLKDNEFNDYSFEMFINYLEFFTMLFTGLHTKYYIDEIGNLNLDFYAYEKIFMDLAETFHYQVQFRIFDIPIVYKNKEYLDREGNKTSLNKYFYTKQQKLFDKNKLKYEKYNLNNIEEYPPYTSFVKGLSDKYRRYDENDDYHICDKCKNLNDYRKTYDLDCSSVFKIIDKTRLINAILSTIYDIDYIKNNMGNKKNYLNNVVKDLIFLPNYKCIKDEIKFNRLIIIFLQPWNSIEQKKFSKAFRNAFGEEIGFFFSWINHYIYWLIFPSLFGLISLIIIEIFNIFSFSNNFFLCINIIFTIIICLWGNYYVSSWNAKEKILAHIWGMNRFKMEKSNDFFRKHDNKSEKKNKEKNTNHKENKNNNNHNNNDIIYILNEKFDDNLEIFMDVKIPLYDFWENVKRNVLTTILILIGLFGTIITNLIVFYIKKINNEKKTKNFLLLFNIPQVLWKFIVPILIYIIRELLSKLFKKLNDIITNEEKFYIRKEYFYSKLKKQLFFEFINYYFNLYYIAFIKKYFETCDNNDCFYELNNQLTIILASDIIVILTKFFYNGIFLRNKIKQFEGNLSEKYKNSNNYSKKFRYYTRNELRREDINDMFVPIIYNFGYIMQFGVCVKLSFLFMLILIILRRLTYGISLKYLYYVKTLNDSKGIGIFKDIESIMVFFGTISNLLIIFFTNKHYTEIEFGKKLVIILITENFIFFYIKLFSLHNFPFWFKFKNKIEMKYLKKYGIRVKNVGFVKTDEPEKKKISNSKLIKIKEVEDEF